MHAHHTSTPFAHAQLTTAQRILATEGRTMRERQDWAEFLKDGFAWIGGDMEHVWFKDGSALLMELDCNLRPVAIVEV